MKYFYAHQFGKTPSINDLTNLVKLITKYSVNNKILNRC